MSRIVINSPQYILVTSDPSKAEPLAPSVLNRAPETIEGNVEKIANRVEKNIENIIAINIKEFPLYDSSYNYMKGDLVKDSDSNANYYVSVADSNKNNALTDTDYWKKWTGVAPNVLELDHNPDSSDNPYPIGQVAVNTDANRVFVQTSVDSSNTKWEEITNNGDTDLAVIVVDSDYNASVNTYILGRTSDSTGNYTISLPSDPADMDLVKIGDYDANANNNPVHIDGNGKQIEGDDSYDLDVNDFLVEITYNGKQGQWVILNR